MAVEFEVETGTGSSTSTSYGTEADFQQYWENKGVDYSALDSATMQPLLNRATAFIDNRYCFQGCVSNKDQALQFPRENTYNKNGYIITGSEISRQLKYATFQLAGELYQADQDAGEITEANLKGQGIKSKSLGPMSITYSESASGVGTRLSYYPEVTNYLKSLIDRAKRV